MVSREPWLSALCRGAVAEPAIFARSLDIVAGLAERLPVVLHIPEDTHVAFVWDDVIDDGSRDAPTSCEACDAERVVREVRKSRFSPVRTVTT